MKTILTLAAAAALSLGLAGTASAAPAGLDAAAKASEQTAGQVGYYWQRGSFWRGRCFYRYSYVSNGYRWRLRYRYRCY
jgi:opacity protein-like surface antigen